MIIYEWWPFGAMSIGMSIGSMKPNTHGPLTRGDVLDGS